ncbi:MAG: class II aldolase/adducin family protein [Halanaerobiales bacterium]
MLIHQPYQKEAGKNPSRSTLLHRYIYNNYPEINSIIIAHPPNIMSFAVTEHKFETKVIPESYIMLQDIPKVPFGSSFIHPKLIAKCFSKERSILMVKNDCIILTGNSLLDTFDKLEVAEFTAKSIISSTHLGEIININPKEIKDIKEAFDM